MNQRQQMLYRCLMHNAETLEAQRASKFKQTREQISEMYTSIVCDLPSHISEDELRKALKFWRTKSSHLPTQSEICEAVREVRSFVEVTEARHHTAAPIKDYDTGTVPIALVAIIKKRMKDEGADLSWESVSHWTEVVMKENGY